MYWCYKVNDTHPAIIGITETWADTIITEAELGLRGYDMFRKDKKGKGGGSVILCVKECLKVFESDCKMMAKWCKVVLPTSAITS